MIAISQQVTRKAQPGTCISDLSEGHVDEELYCLSATRRRLDERDWCSGGEATLHSQKIYNRVGRE